MRWVVLGMLVLTGCGPDRGRCLHSHTETRHQPMFMQPIVVGKVRSFIIHPARDYTVTVCDYWEFPDGRP